MRLYLVRHGHAVTEEEDPSRPLSLRGVEDMRRLVEFFRGNGAFRPLHLWHSPLRRAQETAEILARGMALDGAMLETTDLLPEDDPDVVAKRLADSALVDAVAVVGHEPHLSALATLLVRGRTHPVMFEIKKGAVIALERLNARHKKTGEPRWAVRWHVTPALLHPSRAS